MLSCRLFAICTVLLSVPLTAAAQQLSLRYDAPAKEWTEVLPVGNGRLGAMIFGGAKEEHLQLNEDTLWGGGPHDYSNPDAFEHLAEVRRLIFAGKVQEADKLALAVCGRCSN